MGSGVGSLIFKVVEHIPQQGGHHQSPRTGVTGPSDEPPAQNPTPPLHGILVRGHQRFWLHPNLLHFATTENSVTFWVLLEDPCPRIRFVENTPVSTGYQASPWLCHVDAPAGHLAPLCIPNNADRLHERLQWDVICRAVDQVSHESILILVPIYQRIGLLHLTRAVLSLPMRAQHHPSDTVKKLS